MTSGSQKIATFFSVLEEFWGSFPKSTASKFLALSAISWWQPFKSWSLFSMCLLKNFFFFCCSHEEYVAQITFDWFWLYVRTPGQMVDTMAPSLGGFSSVLYDLAIEGLLEMLFLYLLNHLGIFFKSWDQVESKNNYIGISWGRIWAQEFLKLPRWFHYAVQNGSCGIRTYIIRWMFSWWGHINY